MHGVVSTLRFLTQFAHAPELIVVPKGYVEIEQPNEALEECVRMINGLFNDGRFEDGKEVERHYFWSETQGGIVEAIFEGKAGGFPFRALTRCFKHADGSVSLWTAPADMYR